MFHGFALFTSAMLSSQTPLQNFKHRLVRNCLQTLAGNAMPPLPDGGQQASPHTEIAKPSVDSNQDGILIPIIELEH
ncbi:hypothetical protein CCHR01_09563 [Colletotrichum chrysophilum]|uniref:Uncharacterized protein n=1 Tax=Colletotrichum chrysophilum TaxID=1836956 RepID=A0AAD9AGS4_9PEZI|nr:hypothetical protein K456DRAFT_51517 [Colletotrichum gloeosporioides 23]KAK1847836.1 hypothetical protein CCHR01_09563 [Colletotrichum chrysophilum]